LTEGNSIEAIGYLTGNTSVKAFMLEENYRVGVFEGLAE
jgi:hypothetical protein